MNSNHYLLILGGLLALAIYTTYGGFVALIVGVCLLLGMAWMISQENE